MLKISDKKIIEIELLTVLKGILILFLMSQPIIWMLLKIFHF